MKSLKLVTTLFLILIAGSAANFAIARQNPIGEQKKIKLKPVPVPKELAQTLLKDMLSSGFELEGTDKRAYRSGKLKAAKFFSAYQVQLSETGSPSLFIQQNESNPLCNGHNCPMWVYNQNQNGGFDLLLKAEIGYYDLVVLKQSHNGYNDLVVTQHDSAVTHHLTVFRFNGTVYQAEKCFIETSKTDKQGKVRYLYKELKCD